MNSIIKGVVLGMVVGATLGFKWLTFMGMLTVGFILTYDRYVGA